MFRFLTCSDHFAFRAETDQEREVLSLSWISPRFFKHALSLERWTCSVTSACGAKPCRCAVPSLGPEATGLQAAPFGRFF